MAVQERVEQVKSSLGNFAGFTGIFVLSALIGTFLLKPPAEKNVSSSPAPAPGRISPTNTPQSRSANDRQIDTTVKAALAQTRIQTPAPSCRCQCLSDFKDKKRWFPCGEGDKYTCLPKANGCGGDWVKSTPLAKAR